ncbi:hypothetical protein Bhyg_04305 [Pseudolycoriella hygida]|uniref:Uncharacterized protein n=1 Tax=Pseudolycoriella hygida TaxID=35572 RepID=A0A9Q0S8B2_9DIPT|nr:hypothetical protein Bhyg_04305 [Pseudolycoriella hygida]
MTETPKVFLSILPNVPLNSLTYTIEHVYSQKIFQKSLRTSQPSKLQVKFVIEQYCRKCRDFLSRNGPRRITMSETEVICEKIKKNITRKSKGKSKGENIIVEKLSKNRIGEKFWENKLNLNNSSAVGQLLGASLSSSLLPEPESSPKNFDKTLKLFSVVFSLPPAVSVVLLVEPSSSKCWCRQSSVHEIFALHYVQCISNNVDYLKGNTFLDLATSNLVNLNQTFTYSSRNSISRDENVNRDKSSSLISIAAVFSNQALAMNKSL